MPSAIGSAAPTVTELRLIVVPRPGAAERRPPTDDATPPPVRLGEPDADATEATR